MLGNVIRDPEDEGSLNLGYLRQCLARAGRRGDSSRVERFRLERLGADNSKAYRIRLEYAGESTGPQSLFLKLCDGTFGRSEVDYYRKDYPQLRDAPLPFCYDAVYEDGAYHLLLEDLSATHRNRWDVEPTPGFGAAAATAVARLHGHVWGAARIESAGYRPLDEAQLNRYLAYVEQGRAPMLDELRKDGNVEAVRIAERLFDMLPGAMLRRASDGDDIALVHGDLNPGNILTPLSGDDASDVRLIDRQPFDWSLTNWVGPSDLAYMMVLWWPVERRRLYELDVLRAYRQELLRQGVDYAWERLLDDYRLSALQCIYVPASWCIDDRERVDMKWLWTSELERTLAFDRDWNANAPGP